MSRMTKFLRQKCQVEAYALDESGNPEHNRFGELIYQPPKTCRCRCEKITKDIKTDNGSIVQSKARYFLDGSMEIMTDYRIDGHVLLSVEDYINEYGKCEGYEVYV